jgi:hypothetical protein
VLETYWLFASKGGGVNGRAPAPCGAVELICLFNFRASAANGPVNISMFFGKAATLPAKKAVRRVKVFMMLGKRSEENERRRRWWSRLERRTSDKYVLDRWTTTVANHRRRDSPTLCSTSVHRGIF